MRIFNEPNLSDGWRCPICRKAEKKPVVLIGIAGTEVGKIIEAEQYHVHCIELESHVIGESIILGMNILNRDIMTGGEDVQTQTG